jgi:hypothetical protein
MHRHNAFSEAAASARANADRPQLLKAAKVVTMLRTRK